MPYYLVFFSIYIRLNFLLVFEIFDNLPHDFQGSAPRDMAGHPYENIKNREIAVYRTVNIDLYNFFRINFRSYQRKYPVIGTYKVMPIQQDCQVFIFRREFAVYPNNMDGSRGEAFIGVFYNVGSFGNMERRNGM